MRFAFTNITSEDFISKWGGTPILVKPNETIEISMVTPVVGGGQALAIKMTGELVDKIMIGNAKMDEIKVNQPYYRSPLAASLAIPAARKVYEDKILRQLDPEEESPQLQSLRSQLKEELLADLEKKEGIATEPLPKDIGEFAQLKKRDEATQVVERQPARTKKINR